MAFLRKSKPHVAFLILNPFFALGIRHRVKTVLGSQHKDISDWTFEGIGDWITGAGDDIEQTLYDAREDFGDWGFENDVEEAVRYQYDAAVDAGENGVDSLVERADKVNMTKRQKQAETVGRDIKKWSGQASEDISKAEDDVIGEVRKTVGAEKMLRFKRFLVASSHGSAQVVYAVLGTSEGDRAEGPLPLVESGLVKPAGVAVDTARSILYVADQGAGKVFQYKMEVKGDRLLLRAGSTARAVVEGQTGVVGVTVQANGDVFFSTENSLIGQVDFANAQQPRILYRGTQVDFANAQQSTPLSRHIPQLNGGSSALASDGLQLYYSNSNAATPRGALVRLPASSTWHTLILPPVHNPPNRPISPPGLRVLTKQVLSTTGVCLAGFSNLVYLVAGNGAVWQGETTAQFTDNGKKPFREVVKENLLTDARHCAWDKDGSLLVADRHGINSFAGAAVRTTFSSGKTSTSLEGSKELLLRLVDAHGVAVFYGPGEYEQSMAERQDLSLWGKFGLQGLVGITGAVLLGLVTRAWWRGAQELGG